MYAIFETGGKQYKVEAGDVLRIEKIEGKDKSKVKFDKVLAFSDGKSTKIGTPYLEAATVNATITGNGKGEKVVIFKFKNKKDYRKKQGHRQPYTEVEIDNFTIDGKDEGKKPAKKAAPKKDTAADKKDDAADTKAEDKKPAAKKDAKATEKKPAAKKETKAADKKDDAKAEKKPAAKKTTAKKDDTKATEKKPAAKKTTAKKDDAAKAEKKPAAKKTTAKKDDAKAEDKKPAAKKTTTKKTEDKE